jgi:hypothetical protein
VGRAPVTYMRRLLIKYVSLIREPALPRRLGNYDLLDGTDSRALPQPPPPQMAQNPTLHLPPCFCTDMAGSFLCMSRSVIGDKGIGYPVKCFLADIFFPIFSMHQMRSLTVKTMLIWNSGLASLTESRALDDNEEPDLNEFSVRGFLIFTPSF